MVCDFEPDVGRRWRSGLTARCVALCLVLAGDERFCRFPFLQERLRHGDRTEYDDRKTQTQRTLQPGEGAAIWRRAVVFESRDRVAAIDLNGDATHR